jgi:uncharacterized protein YabE (DUF348 family)
MKRKLVYSALGILFLAGIALFFLGSRKVTLRINGNDRTVTTGSLTVSSVLQQAQIALDPYDQVTPSLNSILIGSGPIVINQVTHYQILVGGQSIPCVTSERIPARVLSALKLTVNPADRIYADGILVDPALSLPVVRSRTLEIRRAVDITLRDATSTRTFQSAAPTLGEALWDEGIYLTSRDQLEPSPETPLTASIQAVLRPSRTVSVTQNTRSTSLKSPAAGTVGEALALSGLSLQGGDYTVPAETASLPDDGQISLVHVTEQLEVNEKYIPYQSESQMNDTVELDQKEVVQSGQYGITINRERLKLENAVEKNRLVLAEQVVKEPVNEIIGYGTKISINTIDTPNGQLEYYRAVQVYATAYSPCHAGTSTCSNATASGMPVQRGVIAVIPGWYAYMAGERVYIPGYGTAVIGDTGGGIPGTPWIDLAFTDADYTGWHSWVTMYFLAPPPSNILYDLN